MFKLNSQEEQAFQTQFKTLCPKGTELNGLEARQFLMKSNLPAVDLASIWELADVSKTGSLNYGEFCAAMKLVRMKLQKTPIPKQLPIELMAYVNSHGNCPCID